MKDIKHLGAGKVRIFGVTIEDGIYPLMNEPENAKVKEMKVHLRRTLYKAWEKGVSGSTWGLYVTNLLSA